MLFRSVHRMLADYSRLMELLRPEIVPYPDQSQILAARHLIRHAADVPILLSAMASRPDWLLTHNTRHFSAEVARRSGLRIATSVAFFRSLAKSLK